MRAAWGRKKRSILPLHLSAASIMLLSGWTKPSDFLASVPSQYLLFFVVGTRTYKFSKNSVVLFISTAYIYVAALGFLHSLSYKGMNLIIGIETGMATM